jgi:hypothetical protein
MPIQRVPAHELRLHIAPESLGFSDTSELLEQGACWIGQERAEMAARFGLTMNQPNYNLFVLGEVGSGRSSMLRQMMHSVAATRPVPPDLCYINNFDEPEHPRALRMSAGQGRELRQCMVQLAKTLQAEIPKRLAAQDFKVESEHIEKAYKQEEDRAYAELDAFAEARSFSLFKESGHLVFTLRDDKGHALTETEALALSKERRQAIDKAEDELRAEIARFLDKTPLSHQRGGGQPRTHGRACDHRRQPRVSRTLWQHRIPIGRRCVDDRFLSHPGWQLAQSARRLLDAACARFAVRRGGVGKTVALHAQRSLAN